MEDIKLPKTRITEIQIKVLLQKAVQSEFKADITVLTDKIDEDIKYFCILLEI
jgi:hypothetical protein